MSKNIFQVYVTNPITSNASTDLMYFGQSPYGAGDDAAMTYANFAAQFGASYTPSALTRTNDTNVTVTLGGTPNSALLQAVSLTMGWSGELSPARGGTGINNGTSTITIGGNYQMTGAFTFNGTLTGNTSVTFPTSGTLATTSQIPTGAALTEVNDTNVTLTLGGSPSTALVNAASITAGWSGQLSPDRGGTGVNNGTSTITIGGNFQMSGPYTFDGTLTGNTAVTFPTSGTLATTAQLTSPAQGLYISNDGNDTTGTGSIELPFATYEKARSVAVLSASSTTPYLIIALGIFNITGDMTLSPFVYIAGMNINAAVFNVTGSVVLDALFDTTANANTALQDLELNAATGINLTFNTFQGASVSFTNILMYETPSIVVVGSGTNSGGEVVVLDSLVSESGSSLTATNIILSLSDSRVGGPVTSINNSSITPSLFFVDNLDILSGNLTIQTTNTSPQTAIITGSNLYESVLTIDGVQNTLIIDSTSYATTPVYLSGASAANIVLTSLSDGVNANTNFTPTYYAPTAGTNFQAQSVTGNLQGIDNTLGTLVAKGSLTWNDVPGTTQTAAADNGYIISNSALTTLTIPATVPEGTVFGIAGKGAAGWILRMNAGQVCNLGRIATSSGGTLVSTNQWDTLQILCVTANTEFTVISSIGNIGVA